VEAPVAGNELPPVAVEQEHFGTGVGTIVPRARVVPWLSVISHLGVIARTCVIALLTVCGPICSRVTVLETGVVSSGRLLGIPGLVLRINRTLASQDKQRREQ
jgi:hypothetical protein